jgi:hypothetical protein
MRNPVALTLDAETDRIIGLAELLLHLERHADARDEASVIAAAPMLRALANNRSFLRDELHRQLTSWRDPRPTIYTSQTFALGGANGIFVRANVWNPRGAEPPTARVDGEMTLYGLPHNHAFAFLTVGYWGPGYRTAIYECDPGAIGGDPDESVELRFLEETTLPVAKVMYYRACVDVHEQGYPPAFSISLNVTVVSPEVAERGQFYFDLEHRKIVAWSGVEQTARLQLCQLAAAIGNRQTEEHLAAITVRAMSPHVRAEAYAALAKLRGVRGAAEVWRAALADRDARVRARARAALEGD